MINWILNGIGKAIWYLLVGPILSIINGFEKIFNFLIFDLFQIIIFREKTVNIRNIPPEFLYFVGFAFIIALFLFFYQIIQGYLHSGERLWTNFIIASKMLIKAFGLIMLIPLIIVALLFLYKGSAWLISFIFKQSNNQWDIGKPMSIAIQIKHLAFKGLKENWNWDLKEISHYPPNWFTSDEWNPIISIVSAWATIYMFYKLSSTIMLKYFKVLGLAIASPVPVIMQIRDEGDKLQSWKNMLLENIFGVLGIYLGYYFFILGMKTISKVPSILDKDFKEISNSSMIIMLGMLIGLVLSVSSVSEWFGDLFVLQNPNLANDNNSTKVQVAKKMAAKSAATLKSTTIGGVTGIAATGILGKTAKHSAKNKIAKKWTNSKIGNSLNTYHNAKSQALNSKSEKAAKKVDKLDLKANKASSLGKHNKAIKLNMKSNKNINKFDKSLTKANKLNKKVNKFNQTKEKFKK